LRNSIFEHYQIFNKRKDGEYKNKKKK